MKVKEEQQLLSLFADDPKAPFSIHKFVEHGASACGKHPGQWFGPSATAQCIRYVKILPYSGYANLLQSALTWVQRHRDKSSSYW